MRTSSHRHSRHARPGTNRIQGLQMSALPYTYLGFMRQGEQVLLYRLDDCWILHRIEYWIWGGGLFVYLFGVTTHSRRRRIWRAAAVFVAFHTLLQITTFGLITDVYRQSKYPTFEYARPGAAWVLNTVSWVFGVLTTIGVVITGISANKVINGRLEIVLIGLSLDKQIQYCDPNTTLVWFTTHVMNDLHDLSHLLLLFACTISTI
ncbi:hypothetical protein QCA50_004227 [Cerrena zonata]|uniref:Cytochrome b561 domain-containing protein n=1 Tax=Cerrena zonata TaxID=2478898 RepID=A0AAW0GH69_9APHY